MSSPPSSPPPTPPPRKKFSTSRPPVKRLSSDGKGKPVKPRMSVYGEGEEKEEVPESVSKVGPVTESATEAITSIKEMLDVIHSVQDMMEALNLSPLPISHHANDVADQHMKDQKRGAEKPKRREQIIGESLDNDNIALTVYPKSDETRKIIASSLSNHFLFSDLEGSGVKDVIDTMEKEDVLQDMVIIQQGEAGDKFYVLEHGSAQIKVHGEKKGVVTSGAAFGELALMWNSPRAATIVAMDDCTLWSLSRPLFRRLLATSSSNQTVQLCEFLNNVPLLTPLGNQETTKIARALRSEMYADGDYIIRQGDEGDVFYIIYKGKVVCTKNEEDGETEREMVRLKSGDFFGERALQKKEPRAANVIACGDVECFTLTLDQFNLLLGGIQEVIYHITTARVLKSVPLLSGLSEEALYSLTNIFKHEKYEQGDFVIREGEEGDHFYVVHDGAVQVTQYSSSLKAEVELGKLESGHYFGEIALLTRAPRTASVQVLSETAELLVMHRNDFQTFMAPFENEIQEQMEQRELNANAKHGKAEDVSDYGDGTADTFDVDNVNPYASLKQGAGVTGGRSRTESMKAKIKQKKSEMEAVVLEDLDVQCVLGMGTFGKVVMVTHRVRQNQVSALKCLAKAHLIRTHQEQNVKRERDAMQVMSHPFVVELRGTLSDTNQVYLLLEYVPGGELWSLLYEKKPNTMQGEWGGMTLKSTVLFAAMCISAFEHIHDWDFCYRDLKPENLLIDKRGYLKIADFGFAKRLPYENSAGKLEDRTFTLCGTPEYMAPEIVLSRGHDKAVDFWSVGILIYEMLCGTTPFEANNQQDTFERIVYSQRYLRFPLRFDPHAKSIIRKLLEANSALRLGSLKGGIQDIKNHLFFSAHAIKSKDDWIKLQHYGFDMEYVPQISGETDSSNFSFVDSGDDSLELNSAVEEFVVGSEGDQFVDF
ncbi:hypothetical protein TrLO_g13979 [Triparma laevis f. longispina]|uniref:cGMP-dependent protein kinase n=1 Tax=Triparma laevis f. longispina TaxID=1714387 RepID=A0A9W7C7L9_9STRA|nr:hypothetical protein TrLO_g13979 [Triparma laevis f. longispina]